MCSSGSRSGYHVKTWPATSAPNGCSPSTSPTAKCTSPVRSRTTTTPPLAKASATQVQGESGVREKGHPTPLGAASDGGQYAGSWRARDSTSVGG